MKNKIIIFVSLFNLINIFSSPLNSQTKPDIEKIDNAVVLVMIYDHRGKLSGHGSGFIIDNKGTVVTNYHVVKGAYSLKVRLDNNGYKEDYDVDYIISGDPSKDLVKISLKNPHSKIFPFLNLSKTFPSKGDDCWAIGTPADPKYMNTVSKGLISNIDLSSDPKILQTNAEITHGSSGGALVNYKGEVIGVTNAGDGSEDGARASINFAIWIGELNNLTPINKQSIIDPASIPCELGFYTNSPYTGNVYLYIDGIYVGSFSKYFTNNSTPSCGADGTITRYLYMGSHSYQVYYMSTGQMFSGTVYLSPGQCQMFKVGGVNPAYSPSNTTDKKNILGFERKKFEYKGIYKWVISSGFSFVETGRGLPLPLFIERYFNSAKYSIRTNVQWIKRNANHGADINYSTSYCGLGLDFKKIFHRPYRWDWFLAATCNYRFINIHHEIFETTYPLGQNGPVTIDKSYTENKDHLFSGLRFGGDRYSGPRLFISWDIGIGYHTFYQTISADGNLLFGYRF